jgi:hypothetical protein
VDTNVSVAEKVGMPFEKRCEAVQRHLQSVLDLFQGVAEIDLQYKEDAARRSKEVMERLPETEREIYEPIIGVLASIGESIVGLDEKHFKKLWEDALLFSRETYGSDAVNFALGALKRKNVSN